MNAVPRADVPKRKGSPFFRRAKRSSLPDQNLARQGLITHLAFALLGGRDPALAFLNSFHSRLGARPLDLAGDSLGGFSSVRGEVLRLASAAKGQSL